MLNAKGKIFWLSLPRESCSSGFQEIREVQIEGDAEGHSASAGVQAPPALSVKSVYSVLTK